MARQESQREDLLREATALAERVELCLPDQPESIVAGFRRDGSASFFFGESPVYQFNSRREFRRGYVSGLLYKTDDGQLYEMRRERKENAVELRSRQLAENEAGEFLRETKCRLEKLRDALSAGQAVVNGQVPDDQDVAARVLLWLQQLTGDIAVARVSRVQ